MNDSDQPFDHRRSVDAAFDFDVSRWEALPPVRGLFVTGTDTDVGKTLVAGAIARNLRRLGRRVAVFKPAASGCKRSRGQLVSGDAEFLAACADTPDVLSDIAPVRYAAALAPNVAAQREGTPVDLDAIFEAYARLTADADVVIVEGVGGLLCPLSDEFWVIHLAMLTGLPLVVVARAGLGTINHALLTLHAARSAGLHVAGVVINRYPPDLLVDCRQGVTAGAAGDIAALTNPHQIASRGRTGILAVVPDDADNSVERITIGSETQYAIAQTDWDALADHGAGG